MKFSLFSAVLFSIGWMSVVASGNRPPPNCCLTLSDTRPPAANIVKYEMQESTFCPLRAVIFYTKRDIAICSDPDSKYAKRVMEIVDGRTTAKPTMCYISTTNMIPAVTTTNKTPGKKTETSTIGDWVQDYMQSSNKRKTTGKTDQSDFARNGGLESFTERIHVPTTTIPVKYILKNLRSRSKKRLHKFQAGKKRMKE